MRVASITMVMRHNIFTIKPITKPLWILYGFILLMYKLFKLLLIGDVMSHMWRPANVWSRIPWRNGRVQLDIANDMTTVELAVHPTNHVQNLRFHDDVIKWKHLPRYWPFVLGIHRSPVNSPHKGQRRGALVFSFISAQINGWVNNREAGDLRRSRPFYDVTVMLLWFVTGQFSHII